MSYLSEVKNKIQIAKTNKALKILYKQAKETKDKINNSDLISNSIKREINKEFKDIIVLLKKQEKSLKNT